VEDVMMEDVRLEDAIDVLFILKTKKPELKTNVLVQFPLECSYVGRDSAGQRCDLVVGGEF
jgi:hypothetical protein